MALLRSVLRAAYRRIPLRARLLGALRRFWRPPPRIYRHLHFEGVFPVAVGSSSFLMQHHGHQLENELFWEALEGGWEPTSTAIWSQLAADARVVVDIGANTGLYALIAQTVNREALVIAFEPLARIWKRLEDNRKLNGYGIVAEAMAVSDVDGVVELYADGGDHLMSASLESSFPSLPAAPVISRVPATRLDSYLACQSRRPQDCSRLGVDLVKIDVEGHEPAVLSGMLETLAESRPTLLIEILFDDVAATIEDILAPFGYRYFDIPEDGSVRPMLQVRKSSGFNVLACQAEVARAVERTFLEPPVARGGRRLSSSYRSR